ncbi:PDZ domain-containing protein [Bacillus sp. T33-2]|uniref:PDZ domain-containing protein n=1 Tax=Bacillus sp. T33-2 TaxID=2054168 RepID=UPI000C773C59|nr:PDZ domain-containing protein [Bacillus sp. T33-2]PLR91932.1 PDZ domain-containing protein [Bacillus sp. T33-2]
MIKEWLWELLIGTGKMFIHPLFYYLIILAGIIGVSRVKRERKNFHIRVEDAFFELRQLLPLGIVIGLAISLVTLAAGTVIPFAAVILTAVFTLLWSLTTRVRLLGPAFTVGAAFFALIFLAGQDWSLPVFSEEFADLQDTIFPGIAVLLAILLIGEGILIRRNGIKGTSPKLIKSKRGLTVGVHEVKRLWMLPVFLIIPGDALAPISWWPLFPGGDGQYSLFLVPFAAGFHQQVQGMLPKEAIRDLGNRVAVLGLVILIIAAAGYWYPIVSITAVALAIIGREAITQSHRLKEGSLPFYFSKKNHGVMILGIIPESPANKMALQVGELITKVNGKSIHDEKSFYEALQRNRAHCKLEVLDTSGQIRFVQRALYEGDHHELGILFVQDEKTWGSEAV